jgi:hypothetical protein
MKTVKICEVGKLVSLERVHLENARVLPYRGQLKSTESALLCCSCTCNVRT